ncbi:S1 family peptidase [Nannocystaceae bacterium ST9]
MSFTASLLLAALLSGSPDHSNIFGGDPVESGDWPAVVAIRTQKLCTGTLVAPNLVLTAAHCFSPAPVGNVFVDFGDTIGDPDFTLVAADWAAHPDFCLPADCKTDLHDFAWVRLPVAVDVTPIVPITDQAEYDDVMVAGQATQFVGFGEDEQGTTGIKREVTSKLTSFNDSGREFRAGGDGQDSCFGDSGGPALIQLETGAWRLAGVLSRGGECGKGGVYGVPLPELCWLRDSSGVDLLPAGCDDCSCVDISPVRDDGCDCSVGRARVRESSPPWGWAGLVGVVVLAWARRRVRR